MKNNDLRESIACVADVILTSVSNVGGAASRSSFCAPNGLNEITRSEFRIFFHADWKIDNGVFNTQILVPTGGAQNKDFDALLQTADRLNQSLVSFVSQAS